MKKKMLGLLCSVFSLGIFGHGNVSYAAESTISAEGISDVVSEDDEFYYVLDDRPAIQSRTWAKTQSYSIKKGSRTYLGTYNTKRKTTMGVTVAPVVINLKNEYSESGKFKKYRQNCAITVTYKRYRKVDNRYVDTKTVTSNTSYIDYVRV
ncbi:hypothetical protein GIX45_23205 [Erwinia sp. CPCC 100877]|nr:hypothetical protein [Erwinia sp. CPCC 100877]